MITVSMAKYSVPSHLIGRKVRVSLLASQVVMFDGRSWPQGTPASPSNGLFVVRGETDSVS